MGRIYQVKLFPREVNKNKQDWNEMADKAAEVVNKKCGDCLLFKNCSEVCDELWEAFEVENVLSHRAKAILITHETWRDRFEEFKRGQKSD